MKKQKGFTLVEFLFVMFTLFCVGSYFQNIYLLTQTDFEPPYQEEILRTVGVFIPPAGVVVAWVDFGDIES